MSRLFTRKSIAFVLMALALVSAFFGTFVLRGSTTHVHAAAAKAQLRSATNSTKPGCDKVSNSSIQVSSGARMYCFGAQPNGNSPISSASLRSHSRHFGTNVNAATPSEDVSPNGTQAYGQSEESTAATGSNVIEAWNDATGFFSPACSPSFKDQLTGWAFSNDGGRTFTDEGGLPNVGCASSAWSGDPSVEAWAPGGTPYFYISSLFSQSCSAPTCGLLVALTACKGGTTISCNSTPTVLATNPGGFNFEDKDFMSIDPVRGRLYVAFTDFNSPPSGDNIDLYACNIATNPASPTCAGPAIVNSSTNGCEMQGAYPAVDLATGDVYVAYENNWFTNLTNLDPCASAPVQELVNKVPGSCASPVATFPNACVAPFTQASVNITSMDGAIIPGYNRFPMNDFPRIAVSDPAGTVSIVWNDARFDTAGDILLQSFDTGSSFPTAVQSVPVLINRATGGWHMLPALRNVDNHGDLQISFYGRAKANTAITNVYAALDVNPLTTRTPYNVLVTTGPSDWSAVSSDIVPNFGDYTDNYVIATPGAPNTGDILYVAWADGRLGDPQPFSDHLRTTDPDMNN